ncbi:MAG: exosortase/archaeosortase family protein [Phycisphaerales bacterium]|nr:MAG: exosortase/archaeosortase family protein [Phycisphaerales bacterium]
MTTTSTISIGPPRRWAEYFGPAARVQLLIVAVLLAVVFQATVTRYLVWTWRNDANWSHGWIIPLISLYFLGLRRDELFRAPVVPCWWGAAALAAALAVFLATFLFPLPYARGVALVVSLGALALLFGGWSVFRIVWFPIAYLLLAVPLPQLLYVNVTFPLRQVASRMAGGILDAVLPGVSIETQSVVIDFYNSHTGLYGHLNVAEACSGMRLIMAFVAIGLAVAYLMHGPKWQRLLVVLSCIPIAVICNMVRVVVTGVLHIYGHEEWARGAPHQLLGIAMLPLALGLFSAVRWLLANLVIEEEAMEEGNQGVRP